MNDGGESFSKKEVTDVIKWLKMNKTVDEDGMIAEYLKALNRAEIENVRKDLNEIVNGNEIPND